MIPVNLEIVEAFRQLQPHEIEDAYSLLLPKYRLEWAVCNAKPPDATTSKSLEFAEAFHNRTDKSIFAAIGGNRSSKSFTAGWLCFALFLRECAKAGDVFWCIAQNLDRSMQGQQRELWQALPRHMFIHDGKMQEWTEKGGFGGHRKIVLPCKGGGNCMVEFRSADQEPATFEQAKLRGAWVDEACPEWMLDRLLARIIDLNGWLLFSDIRHQWWQEQRLIAPPPPQDKAVHCQIFCMRDNAHNLPAGAIEKARNTMTQDEARMRIDGESGLSEGIVFKGFRDAQIIPPFKIPSYWPKWRAIDYGSSAPTACLWMTINEEEEVYVYREYYEVSPSVAHSAKCIQDLSPADEEYRCTFIDPHAKDRPPAIYGMSPSVADQFAENGMVCVGWPYIQIMGEHACVERIKLRDERGTIKVFSSCPSHIHERRNWKHKCDKDGKPLAVDAYENENSHSIDCLKGFLAANPTYTPRTIDVLRK